MKTVVKKQCKTFLFLMMMLTTTVTFGQYTPEREYRDAFKEMYKSGPFLNSTLNDIKMLLRNSRRFHGAIKDDVWKKFEEEYAWERFDMAMEILAPVYQKYLNIDDINELKDHFKNNGKDLTLLKAYEKLNTNQFSIYDESQDLMRNANRTIDKDVEQALRKRGLI